jgi:hypothetical protein
LIKKNKKNKIKNLVILFLQEPNYSLVSVVLIVALKVVGNYGKGINNDGYILI